MNLVLLFGVVAAPAAATMHGDSAASDTTPLPGYGTAPVTARTVTLGAACPAILIGSDDQPVADALQLAGQVGPGRTFWQGTISGLARISSGS